MNIIRQCIKDKTMTKMPLRYVQGWARLKNLLEAFFQSLASCDIFTAIWKQHWTEVTRMTTSSEISVDK